MHVLIRLKGHLDPSWHEHLGGLGITQEANGTTRLSGALPDQSALFGVLAKIDRLNLTLLSLERSDLLWWATLPGRLSFPGEARGTAPKQHKETSTGTVVFGLSVSLDGFIADTRGDVTPVFSWMGRAMDQFHEVVGDTREQTGAVVMGHRTFEEIDSEQGWVFPDGTAPDWPVMVVQSQARAPVKKGKTQYYFVTDGIQRAIARAKELAGQKQVAVHGASAVQQALREGLLDEFHLAVAHVLLGKGVRFFDQLGLEPVRLEHLRTEETPGATHLAFRVIT